MDYEKKYNEALSQARFYYGNCPTEPEKKKLEKLFPELRESEDERVRKAALEGIEYLERKLGWDAIGDTDILDVKEYLEKQKEQKPISSCYIVPYIDDKIAALQDMWREEKVAFDWDDMHEMIEDVARHFYQKEQKPTPDWMPRFLDELRSKKNYFDWDEHRDIEGHILAIINWIAPDYFKRKEEQKPAEKQDYSRLNDLERAIHRGFLCAGVENVPVGIIKETAKECITQMKPAEWSEEDEKVYNNALDALYYKDLNDKDDVLSALKDLCDLIIRKRKVIPPYSRWKPSEEQISSLKQARDYYMSGDIKYVGRHLSEIAEQLEKLM